MNEELEALIVQNQNSSKEINDNLEALIVQTQNNDNKDELEAIAKANIDTKNVIKKGNKDLINTVKKAISDIKFPEFPEYPEQKEEIIVKNINEANNGVVEKLEEIKSELSKEQTINIKLTLV